MEKEELISVIVPVYKVEKYLDKCVKSIVNQTYKNLEIILIDDGSPDMCPIICDRWAASDSRIKVIHKVNSGIADVRNVGIQEASGQYIGFVDSDDYIESDMYEKLYNALQGVEADLALCGLNKFYEDGTSIGGISPIINGVFSKKEIIKKLTEYRFGYFVVPWNKLYTRKALTEIEFPIGKIHEDEFVICNVLLNCNKIVTIEDKLYNYLQRDGSIVHTAPSVKSLDQIEGFCVRIQTCKENDLVEYLPEHASFLRQRYILKRKLIQGPYSVEEKHRIREIDKLFSKTYRNCVEKIGFVDWMLCAFPNLTIGFMKLKDNMLKAGNNK